MEKAYGLLIPTVLFVFMLPYMTLSGLLILVGLAISNIILLDKIERVLDDGH